MLSKELTLGLHASEAGAYPLLSCACSPLPPAGAMADLLAALAARQAS